MIKISLVDDDPSDRSFLHSLVSDSFEKTGIEMCIRDSSHILLSFSEFGQKSGCGLSSSSLYVHWNQPYLSDSVLWQVPPGLKKDSFPEEAPAR